MDENDDSNEIINGLAFPRLRWLHLFVDFYRKYIPRIQGHCIEELDVDPHREVYPISKVDSDTMSATLEQIPVGS
jgi:hypothetical protein